jgi:hypothetical protein
MLFNILLAFLNLVVLMQHEYETYLLIWLYWFTFLQDDDFISILQLNTEAFTDLILISIPQSP